MGNAPGVGDDGACFDARCREALDQHGQHRGLAAMEMIGAGRVDHQAVGRIGHDDGRDALQGPERELFEPLGVRLGIGIHDNEAGRERLRLCGGHADAQAKAFGDRIQRGDGTSSSLAADEHERRLTRRRCVG